MPRRDQLELFDDPVADRGRAGAGINKSQNAHARDLLYFTSGFKIFPDDGFRRFDDDLTGGAGLSRNRGRLKVNDRAIIELPFWINITSNQIPASAKELQGRFEVGKRKAQ